MEKQEKSSSKIWAQRDDIEGGKYLVLRRDNTVLPGPHFVLGPRDPIAEIAMLAYADAALKANLDFGFVASCYNQAGMMRDYRKEYGDGDPDRGPHRKDELEIIKRMVNGH